jgi:glycolate oxidase
VRDRYEPSYNRVSLEHVIRLREIAGESAVLYGDPEKMEMYSYDEATRADREYQQMPEVVVKVQSALQVSEILKLANEAKVPVTPRGAGSGLSGAAVPIYGGILLSMEKMNRVLEIDRDNLMAVVEAGVITNDLNLKAQQEGLFFAGYPMSFENCFIGGNAAHNAGGGRAIKYGVTGHHILGLEVVLPTGEIVNYGGKRLKDVTGYNMVQLMLGAEGTLGVITKVIVKLLPLPEARAVMMVLFDDLHSALAMVPAILNNLRIIPSAIEFMDRAAIAITYNYLGTKKPHEDAGALLLIEVDGNEREQVRNQCLKIGDFCLENGALDAVVAETPREQEALWRVRIACPEALQNISTESKLVEDLVVPLTQISRLIDAVHEIGARYNIYPVTLGHAGDGNIHINAAKPSNVPLEEWKSNVPLFLTELYTRTRELGGTISGEHGIAHKRKQYLHLVMSADEINSMKKIKAALDPNLVLNPGKKFDMD